MRLKDGSADEVLAEIAGRQHGLVTTAQLVEAGLSRPGVARRVAKGSLLRVHRGVYRVGHEAPSVEARYLGAVLACGDGAVLSGLAAAWHYGLVKGHPPVPVVSTERHRRVPGVSTRRLRRLDRRDATTWRDIPVTTVPRTLVDLAGPMSLDDLARACHEAEVRYRVRPRAIDGILERRPSVPGAFKLREIFHGQAAVTLSRLERAFLRVLRANGLPLPQTNRPAGGRYVDCRWPELRLTVELDSYRYHHSRHAWEQDRRREREARARGDEFRRYTYADVVEDRRLMLAELRELASGRTSR
jgi:very-short-patch-repair endonuclease